MKKGRTLNENTVHILICLQRFSFIQSSNDLKQFSIHFAILQEKDCLVCHAWIRCVTDFTLKRYFTSVLVEVCLKKGVTV